jgi:oligopeptide transport system ATP-binding protein
MKALVQINQLSKRYHLNEHLFFAVKDLSFSIFTGETVGLVGESGSGKSTLGKLILNLIKPSSGSIYIDGKDLHQCKKNDLLAMRKRMQMIFQDSSGSLNPLMTIQEALLEPLIIHGIGSRACRQERVEKLLLQVGLDPALMKRYPHELSGGQRQRIVIARGLILNPTLVVCDEPVSALDCHTQRQIVDLLKQLKDELAITYLLISHDLGVIQRMANRLAVLYLGHLLEMGETDSVYLHPQHPYTKALISAIPVPDPLLERSRPRIILQGEPPSPLNPPSGCPFHPRCPHAKEICRRETPLLQETSPGRFVACHFPH